MEITNRERDGIPILDLDGSLTIASGDELLRNRFRALIDAGQRNFVLNMVDVHYMDSGGLGELAACSLRACERGGVVKLVIQPAGKVARILQVTHLDRAFEIFHDEDAALASFAA